MLTELNRHPKQKGNYKIVEVLLILDVNMMIVVTKDYGMAPLMMSASTTALCLRRRFWACKIAVLD